MTTLVEKDGKSWKRMRFKNNKVWVSVEKNERPVVENGKVLIKYQLDQDYEYRVNDASIQRIDSSTSTEPLPEKQRRADEPAAGWKSRRGGPEDEPGDKIDAICVYADGASSGNPGPAGVGVLLRYGTYEKEISRYIGEATNNIAELEAIRTGLSAIKDKNLPVRVFTDSSYAHGVLSLGWKPRKNMEIVDAIKNILTKFKDIKFVKIKGHAGVPGNERADLLARSALRKATDMK